MPVGLLSFGAPLSAFNGGRSQIGLNFVQIGNEYPFLNNLKTAQSWSYVDNSGPPAPDELDANGYLVSGAAAIAHGGVYTAFYVPTQADRPGRYAITWSGSGTIYTGMTLSEATGAKTAGGGPGGSNRYEFLPGTHRFLVGHTTGGDVSDIKVFHVDDEADVLAGNVFGKKFLERLRESRPAVLRFLDWQAGNTSVCTTWATRKPVDYVFYQGGEYRASLYCGVTSGTGDDYVCDEPPEWPGLVDKSSIIVFFDRASSGDSATLSVGGAAAKPIKQRSGTATSPGSNSRPAASRYGYLVYDADLDAWLKTGGDAASSHQALANGAPMELMVQLCAEIGAHPHFVTPPMAADPLTDFMPSLAAYCRDNGPSWMVPRFEGTNETWNNIFYATIYAGNKSTAHWGSSNYHQWYGKVMSVLGQAISTVYSADRSKYLVVAGVQTSITSTSDHNPRLNSSNYVAQGASAQPPYLKDAAYKWVTHVCCATYITPTRYGTLQELIDGFAYVVTNAGDDVAQAALAASYAATYEGAAAIYNLEFVKARYQQWSAWAQGPWGDGITLGLTAYEGGPSPDYLPNAWSSPITGATNDASGCVLTLATTSGSRGSIAGGGNPAVVGMSISIASVGGMTQLNGNTYEVSEVDVGGDTTKVRIDVDSSGFSTFTSGGVATYVNAPLYTNTLRWASKFAPDMYAHTLTNYQNFLDAGGVHPSQFLMGGTSFNIETPTTVTTNAQVWPALDPSIYADNSPTWDAIVAFNNP